MGLKKFYTLLIDELKTHYNFIKKHSTLQSRTLAQASAIEVDGKTDGKPSFKTPVSTEKI